MKTIKAVFQVVGVMVFIPQNFTGYQQNGFVDPKDKAVIKDPKTSVPFTLDDLMIKLRSSGPTASLFEPVGNGAGSGMTRSNGVVDTAIVRSNLEAITSRSDRLAKIRKLGIK